MSLFTCDIAYIEGGRTSSGFYTVEETVFLVACEIICLLNFGVDFKVFANRMYRVHAAGASIHLEPVTTEMEALDPRYVFVIDCGTKIYVWQGRKSKNTLKSKSRLVALQLFWDWEVIHCSLFRLLCEKINKNERKNKAEIINETPGDESSEFWRILGDEVGLPPEDPPEVIWKLFIISLIPWIHTIGNNE